MNYLRFSESSKPRIALLIKTSCCHSHELKEAYVLPLERMGIAAEEIMAAPLQYNPEGRIPMAYARDYLADLLPDLNAEGIEILYAADAAYFKALTKKTKAEPFLGYVLPCALAGYEHMQVVYGVNHHSIIYNPVNQDKLDLSLTTLAKHAQGKCTELGKDIIRYESYPDTVSDIKDTLEGLLTRPELFIDIEAFSLRKTEAGIGTIAFAWNKNEGVAFCCDYQEVPVNDDSNDYGKFVVNEPVRQLLKDFFQKYTGSMYWHRANYDLGVIIHTLWMDSLDDYEGLLTGLEIMCPEIRWHDTRLIAYLALNSCARPDLSLKGLAHSYAGNYAVDVTDIRKQPRRKLLRYNLIDALCTAYVRDTYWDKVIDDNQIDLYYSMFLPSQKTIIQIELVGMPLYRDEVKALKTELESLVEKHTKVITSHPAYSEATFLHRCKLAEAANSKLKKLRKTDEDFTNENLNVNSNIQLAMLLHEVIGLPVIETTDTGLPAVGAEVLENLKNHTKDQEVLDLLEALISLSSVNKVLTSFIPAFESAPALNDSIAMLHGSFNLGGTVSGRLSSSDPNLQNIPSGSDFGKAVKKCFGMNKDWIFCGADFNSLEDYISALTTKDPNKLKVYLDGYDGHCLRASYYFKDQMPDINESVESVNSIKEKYPHLRQESKSPTFALTYQGTWSTLVKNCGFSQDKAKAIESNYHELYRVSDEYIQRRLDKAVDDGYVEVAFGLRVRTPLLGKSVKGLKGGAIAAEGRTAGNAMGQSYGQLTNRSMNAFMRKVWANPEMRLKVLPVAMIHDANYFLIRNEPLVVEWVNNHLIEEMEWQELPEIQHDKVKLGAALDLFWPSWKDKLTLPNKCSVEEIIELCAKHQEIG